MDGCGGQAFEVLHSPQSSRGLLTQQQPAEKSLLLASLFAHKVSFTIRYPEVQKEVNLKNPELANPKVSFELNWVCL